MIHDVQGVLDLIQKNTYTVGDMSRRVGILRECLETVLFSDETGPVTDRCVAHLQSLQASSDVDAVIAWGAEVYESFSQSTVSEKIIALQKTIESLPVLTLYVPVPFADAELAVVGEWCREHCDPHIVLDMHIEPEVVGGCGFVWHDVYHEFSLKSRMHEQRGVVTELLSAYEK